MRRARLADVAAITALTRAAYARWVPVIGREPLPMVADYAAAVARHWIDLWHEGDDLAALVEMVPRADHLWIENLAVSPDHQGKGLGRVMLAHAENMAQGAGLAQIKLLTNAAFAANLVFYPHMGFAEERREPFQGGETVYFTMSLTR
jgi:GNAT superfamily N-acetyltransferase